MKRILFMFSLRHSTEIPHLATAVVSDMPCESLNPHIYPLSRLIFRKTQKCKSLSYLSMLRIMFSNNPRKCLVQHTFKRTGNIENYVIDNHLVSCILELK